MADSSIRCDRNRMFSVLYRCDICGAQTLRCSVLRVGGAALCLDAFVRMHYDDGDDHKVNTFDCMFRNCAKHIQRTLREHQPKCGDGEDCEEAKAS